MDKDVDAAHVRESSCSEAFTPRGRRQVCPDELRTAKGFRVAAGCSHHPRATRKEAFDGGAAQPLGAAADNYALVSEPGWISRDAHSVISSILMESLSSVKS